VVTAALSDIPPPDGFTTDDLEIRRQSAFS
jgi:hypothetical protein